MEVISSQRAFEGQHVKLKHFSKTNQCDMKCALFLPPQYDFSDSKVPLLVFLSGLTCNEENFMQKAGAMAYAASLGWAILCPDTSPRGEGVPDANDGAWDLGLGAGFYVNATQAPWQKHYQMYDYICKELINEISNRFDRLVLSGISGHSMGGHGALVIGLSNTGMFNSISAFSPITNPIECPWGQNAFLAYLGNDKSIWKQYDTCELIKQAKSSQPILVDQGADDSFLEEQLKPQNLLKAALACDYPITVDIHPGYDHSYYFVSTFVNKHLDFHNEHYLKSMAIGAE
jgi:S-formylglutathione hydrolase